MTPFRFTLVAGLALVLASCSKQSGPNGKDQAGTFTEDFGHLGQTSSGSADAQFVIKCPYWRTGDQAIVCGLAEYPGRPLQPAFVLLLKLPSTTNFGASTSVGSDGEKSYWHQDFRTSGEKTHPIRYEIKHKPVGEQLTLGEKTYALDSGQVFLVDLAAQPVQVIQVLRRHESCSKQC
jgi:hypothetical protein